MLDEILFVGGDGAGIEFWRASSYFFRETLEVKKYSCAVVLP